MQYTITPRKFYSHLLLGATLAIILAIIITYKFHWGVLYILFFPILFYLMDKSRSEVKIDVDDEKVVFHNCTSKLKEGNQRIDRLCIERSQIVSCRTTNQLRYTRGGWDITLLGGEHIYVDNYSMIGRGTSWLKKVLNGDGNAPPPTWDWQPHIIFTCAFLFCAIVPILTHL